MRYPGPIGYFLKYTGMNPEDVGRNTVLVLPQPNRPMRDNPFMRVSLLLLVSAGLLPAAPRIQVKLGGSTLREGRLIVVVSKEMQGEPRFQVAWGLKTQQIRSEEHTSELQSRQYLVCRLLLEK